jgi:hypothetical protein
MTKTIEDKIQSRISIMAAFLCGFNIEFKYKTSDVWMAASNPDFDFINFDYRIEPQEGIKHVEHQESD